MSKCLRWVVLVVGLVALGCSGEATYGSFDTGGGGGGNGDGGGGGGSFDGGGGGGTPDANLTGPPPWPVCAEQSGEAKLVGGGVDIIIFVDTSGSMSQETAWVQQNMNAFAQFIASKNLDYHVVMIAEQSSRGICMAPPLGGANCADGPRYRQVKTRVSSTNGLQLVLSEYPKYQSFLRAGATVNFVAVTDDNSRISATAFETGLKGLTNPGFPNGFIFHSIVAFGSDPLRGCPTGARYGKVYEELSKKTNGAMFKICETNWKPIFDKLAQSVAQSAKPPCSYALPKPPSGKTIQPAQIRVNYELNGQSTPIPRVNSESACGNSKGFYYDNNTKPTQVIFCPATCSSMKGGKIKIIFGCTQIG